MVAAKRKPKKKGPKKGSNRKNPKTRKILDIEAVGQPFIDELHGKTPQQKAEWLNKAYPRQPLLPDYKIHTPEAKEYQDLMTEFVEKLKVRAWRMNNLYYISDEKGAHVKFKMKPEQQDLYDNKWYLNIILKARQLGFSTFVAIFILDTLIMRGNTTAGIIDATLSDAIKKLEKIRYAYHHLPDAIKNEIQLTKDNEQELKFSNGSSVTADTSFRGSTVQLLHISEHAKICKKDPIKAREIKNGALNAVAPGQMIFIESTAEDGEGDFFDICQKAELARDTGEELTKIDFKFHFYSWFKEARYDVDPPKNYTFSNEMVKYFDGLEQELGITLSPGQRYFYVRKAETLGDDIKKEYPSTSKEAFESSTEDKYYHEQMLYVKRQGQITEFPYESGIFVDTYWDLGIDDYTSILFVQQVGKEVRVIDFLEGTGEDIGYYAQVLKEGDRKAYNYGKVYLPHDGNTRHISSDKTVYQRLSEYGFKCDVVSKHRVEDGINQTRKVLRRVWFRKSTTGALVNHIDMYSKKWSPVLGKFTGPKHNQHSHAADALRYMSMTLGEVRQVDSFGYESYTMPLNALASF